MSWIYVAVGIACLIVLQLLRSGLSIVFPTYRVRPIRKPDPASFGGIELVDAKISAYNSLGFKGPAWLGCDQVPAGADPVAAHATFRNQDEHIVAWLGPAVELTQPNQLLTYYTTLLEDGRYAVTQISDPYFEAVADPLTPAQTIAAGDEAEEIAAHRRFVAELGVRPANSTPGEDVLRFAAEHMNGIRQRLLERGDLSETDGIARPGFRFAFRLLKAIQSRPKPKKAALPGNPTVAHLGALAKVVEFAKSRAPAQHVQWQLLTISVVLSLAIGWPIFGLEFTAIVVAVIAFHEAGHWLAMRLFGYGNPHITLLPLVGGVAIGHENSPNAAHRAWVALAGPLPGIVLGWLLFWASASATEMYFGDGALYLAAVILLFVNYLNVLPIPPLDGHHVVQAILPPRWVMLQVLLIAVGVALGAYVAWQLDFWPLALIAALQLLGVQTLWRQARIVKDLRTRPIPDTSDEASARTWLFDTLQQMLGPAVNPAKRVGLANGVLNQLRLKPMGAGQCTIVATVYGLLLIVPIVALAFVTGLPFGTDEYTEDPEIAAIYETIGVRYGQLLDEADRKDVGTLIGDLCAGSALPPPASEQALADLRDRLGGDIPANLESFYEQHNGGCPGLELDRAEDIAPLDPSLLIGGDLEHFVFDGDLYFLNESSEERRIPIGDTARWWLLGNRDSNYAFLDPDPPDGAPTIYVMGELAIGADMFPTVDAWLRERWSWEQYDAFNLEQQALIAEIRRKKVAHLSVKELLDLYPKPNLLLRLIVPELSYPGPASAAQLSAVEALVGRPLPEDHREALEIHDGFVPFSVLATGEIVAAAEIPASERQQAIELAANAGVAGFDNLALASCWAVGGYVLPSDDGYSTELFASLLWCPGNASGQRYLSLRENRVYASYIDALRDYAAVFVGY